MKHSTNQFDKKLLLRIQRVGCAISTAETAICSGLGFAARKRTATKAVVYPNPLLFVSGTDPAKAQKNEQAFSMFNGRLDNGAVRVNPGDLVRMYFVNVGPGVSSAHVIGTVLDRVYDGRDPIYG